MHFSKIFLSLLFFCYCSTNIACSSNGDSSPLANWKNLNSSDKSWYSDALRALGEKKLAVDKGESAYRLTLLRTFHKPLSVRINCLNDCFIRAARSSGKGGYDPGRLEMELSRSITKKEKDNFFKLLSEAEFWKGQPELDYWGFDGARWILEGKLAEEYVVWDIWSPMPVEQYQRYVALCLFMIQISNIEIDGKLY